MKDKIKKSKKGFTLIEMLIAVMIFSLSITSLMSISSKSIKSSREAQNQVIADYLAVEAIEIVHNLRDTAMLNGLNQATWELVFSGGEGLFDSEGCFDGSGVCNFYSSGDRFILSKCEKCSIFLNKNRFYYHQVHEANPNLPIGSKQTKYKRTIKIKKGDVDGQILVKVDVSWPGGLVTYVDNIYLWQ